MVLTSGSRKEEVSKEQSLDGERRMIKLSFNVTNALEVPVNLVFKRKDKEFELILKEKGSKRYEIATFAYSELFNVYCYDNIILVKWNMGNSASTDDPAPPLPDFASLLASGKFSDIEIETEDGSRISAHRNILSARSSVLCAMLESDILETGTRCIEITDFPAQTVWDMVTYMYTSRVPNYNCEWTAELLKAADKYDLKALKDACSDSLSLNLTVANAMKVLLLADVYRDDCLKRKALDFISKNRSAFTDPSKFDSSVKQRPDLLVEVINSIAKP